MMRYKQMVLRDLDMMETLLKAVQSGLNNSSISPAEAYRKVSDSIKLLENATEKVNLEPDQTS